MGDKWEVISVCLYNSGYDLRTKRTDLTGDDKHDSALANLSVRPRQKINKAVKLDCN